MSPRDDLKYIMEFPRRIAFRYSKAYQDSDRWVDDHVYHSFLAQEVEHIDPTLVHAVEHKVGDVTYRDLRKLVLHRAVPRLVGAVKSLHASHEALKATHEALKGEVETLKATVATLVKQWAGVAVSAADAVPLAVFVAASLTTKASETLVWTTRWPPIRALLALREFLPEEHNRSSSSANAHDAAMSARREPGWPMVLRIRGSSRPSSSGRRRSSLTTM